MRSLKTNAAGYDDIPCNPLKLTADYITIPLTHIINLSFLKGRFPDKLNYAKAIPLHKSGDKNDLNNYRLISILPSFSKIFEKTIRTRLVKYLENNNLLSNCQYGFRENRSTQNAILNFVSSIYMNLDF